LKNKRKWLAAPYGVWALGFIIIPLLMIVYYAFTSQEDGRFTLSNFSSVFTATTMKALGLALGLAILGTLICLLLAYPLAMILAGAHVGSSAFIVLIFVLPMWMNFLLRTFAWQTLLENNGVINSVLRLLGLPAAHLINTPAAIVFGMVYNFLPFMILPIYNVLIKIDRDVIEAARDLGAGPWTTFRKITLPLSVSGIISGITMVFVPSLTTFVISDLLGGGKILLIGNLIEQEFKQLNDWNVGSAMSMVLMIFIVLSMMVSARYDREGEGAVF
jgi:spermidine/putrescine transport system permease protein